MQFSKSTLIFSFSPNIFFLSSSSWHLNNLCYSQYIFGLHVVHDTRSNREHPQANWTRGSEATWGGERDQQTQARRFHLFESDWQGQLWKGKPSYTAIQNPLSGTVIFYKNDISQNKEVLLFCFSSQQTLLIIKLLHIIEGISSQI